MQRQVHYIAGDHTCGGTVVGTLLRSYSTPSLIAWLWLYANTTAMLVSVLLLDFS